MKNNDIICLYECWLKENDDISLENYISKPVNRIRGKGGGIVVYIKDTLENVCTVDNVIHDHTIVIRVHKKLFSDDRDCYIICNYIPPYKSNYYGLNDKDVFQDLSECVARYKDFGTVIVVGDLNSRTGQSEDFIKNDLLGKIPACNLLNMFEYIPDTTLQARCSEDTVVNHFGRKLLDLCKASGLRILNKRHPDDPKW